MDSDLETLTVRQELNSLPSVLTQAPTKCRATLRGLGKPKRMLWTSKDESDVIKDTSGVTRCPQGHNLSWNQKPYFLEFFPLWHILYNSVSHRLWQIVLWLCNGGPNESSLLISNSSLSSCFWHQVIQLYRKPSGKGPYIHSILDFSIAPKILGVCNWWAALLLFSN